MILQDIARIQPAVRLVGDSSIPIHGVTADSRLVKPGWLFVAVPGLLVDGHDYADQAVRNGAAAILAERPLPLDIPQAIVSATQPLLGHVAALCHQYPSEKLRVIGITGTKGKTSTSFLVDHLLRAAGRSTSLVGSIGGRVANIQLGSGLTTRAAEELQMLMHTAVDAGETHWVMEVGSHSLAQRRVAGIDFATAIFTNLSRDHLDYHGTMEQYLEAKMLLFSWLGSFSGSKNPKIAILNDDDPVAEQLRLHCGVPTFTYGLTSKADLWADHIELRSHESSFEVHWLDQSMQVRLPLVGRFNIYNTLAACAACIAENIDLSQMVHALSLFPGIPGRFQRINEGQPFAVVVDYAHTEDSLKQVLAASRDMTERRIILVCGCTGDRDKGKRPLMGKLACALADWVVFTSDDPHSEDPEAIIDAMVADLPSGASNWQREADRSTAVNIALHLAQPGDIVLLAGKGHETVQVFDGYSVPYSDIDTAKEALQRLGYGSA